MEWCKEGEEGEKGREGREGRMVKFLVDSFKNFVRPVMVGGKGGKLVRVWVGWGEEDEFMGRVGKMGMGMWGIDADLEDEEVKEYQGDEKSEGNEEKDNEEEEEEQNQDPQEKAFLFSSLFPSLRNDLYAKFPRNFLAFLDKNIDKNFDLLLSHFSSLLEGEMGGEGTEGEGEREKGIVRCVGFVKDLGRFCAKGGWGEGGERGEGWGGDISLFRCSSRGEFLQRLSVILYQIARKQCERAQKGTYFYFYLIQLFSHLFFPNPTS